MALARKEALQLRRDSRSLALAFLLPVFLIVFFGYAISFDVRNLELAVLDQDRSSASRALVSAFESSGYFTIVERLERYGDVEPLLERGGARLVLAVPPDFSARLGGGRTASLQMLLDGGDANTATIAQNYAEVIVNRFALSRGPTRAAAVDVRTRVWFNETLESRNMIVPGLVAVIMSIIAAMLTALTIAREWERGTMEQLVATPVRRSEVIVGKLIPYAAIGALDVAIAAVAGIVLFDVPFRGSVALLAALTLLFLFGALGLGVFISAAVKSQVLATQAAIMATYLPALLLSGFIFSISAMPLVLRVLTHVVPARYYVTVTKGIFLKGVGMSVLWPDALAMLLFASVGLGLAYRAFHKEIA
jgi:ABC-2 type transport system permease protein